MASQPPVQTPAEAGQTPSPAPSPQDDMAAAVADVFGINFDIEHNQPPAGADNGPSVGTEGGAGGGTQPPSSAPSPAESGGDGSAAPAQPQPTPTPGQEAGGQPGTEPPAQPTSDPRALENASLKARLEAAEATIASLQPQQPGNQPPGAGQSGGQPGQPPQLEPIQIQLPQPMLEAIRSEDDGVAAQGLNTLVSVIATGLVGRFRNELQAYKTEVEARFNGLGAKEQQASEEAQAQQTRDEYFKTFPMHNQPVFLPIIAQEAALLAAEHPGVKWDENFRNTLGVRVNEKLAAAGVQLGPVPNPPAPAPTPTPQPAAMLPSGSRPAPDGADDNIIADTLEFG